MAILAALGIAVALAHGAAPPAAAEGGRLRRGRGSDRAHDSDPAAERLSLFAR